jgi:nitroimidazol reductase NimA-like FMN-containing flavoprotein (pyridoxamine 5'-phosphate oxidase superfamily)
MTIDAVRPVQTWTIDLAEEDSRRLLGTAAVGRLGVVVKGRPEIFPIAHAYDAATGCVVFPTRPGTKMEAAFDWPWVAFEVDGLDDDGNGAWSVAIVGHAEEVTDAGEIARARDARRVPWAAGAKVGWIRIVPSKLTGRRIWAQR